MGATTDLKLWTGILAGPAAWSVQLALSYPIAQVTCHASFASQHPGTLHAIAFGALAAVAAAAWLPRPLRHASHPRVRFMARLGLLTCALFALVVIATWFPVFVLHDCQA